MDTNYFGYFQKSNLPSKEDFLHLEIFKSTEGNAKKELQYTKLILHHLHKYITIYFPQDLDSSLSDI